MRTYVCGLLVCTFEARKILREPMLVYGNFQTKFYKWIQNDKVSMGRMTVVRGALLTITVLSQSNQKIQSFHILIIIKQIKT